MPKGVNLVFLIGHLGADPELKTTRNGTPTTRLSLATNHRRKTPDGEWEEDTEWHSVRVYGAQAETCHRHLRRGRLVSVEGRLHHYKREESGGPTTYHTEVIAQNVGFLDRAADAGAAQRSAA